MNSTPEDKEQLILIPKEKLSKHALSGLIEEFILREGTDYGHADVTLDDKLSKVYRQLEAGHVAIVYSTLTENTSLMTKSQIEKTHTPQVD